MTTNVQQTSEGTRNGHKAPSINAASNFPFISARRRELNIRFRPRATGCEIVNDFGGTVSRINVHYW